MKNIFVTIVLWAATPLVVLAQTKDEPRPGKYGYIDPLRGMELTSLIGGGIRVALGVVGTLFLFMFIYGGFLWMTAGGGSERIKKAKTTIVNAVIGMLIVMLSYTLVSVILNFAASVPK